MRVLRSHTLQIMKEAIAKHCIGRSIQAQSFCVVFDQMAECFAPTRIDLSAFERRSL